MGINCGKNRWWNNERVDCENNICENDEEEDWRYWKKRCEYGICKERELKGEKWDGEGCEKKGKWKK